MNKTWPCACIAASLLAAANPTLLAAETYANKKVGPFNVLFIAVDDLAPRLGCYGDRLAQTPNIDELARRGFLFNRAYCQQALCSPSRISLLTGRHPETTKVYDLTRSFRAALPKVTTLPQHFKNNGYHTQALGKVYHAAFMKRAGAGGAASDDRISWSVPWWAPQPHYYHSARGIEVARQWFGKTFRKKTEAEMDRWKDDLIRGLPWEAPDVPDSEVLDARLANRTIEVLGQLKNQGKPFFLGVGFYKPHLPFVAPKKYFDMYPLEKVSLPANRSRPKGAPVWADMGLGELRAYHGMAKPAPSDDEGRELIRAYYACTSFVDAQVGRLLKELDRLQLRDRTVVILWGDHGYHLGENGVWCKQTNYEIALRSPLIISVPGQKHAGEQTNALVEFVDVFPSLVEICGLSKSEGLEGVSFRPLLDDPKRPWKKAVFSQYPRGAVMGTSMRTDRYRYTEWAKKGEQPVGLELYDLATDPGGTVNVASRPENKALVAQLARQLRAGWQAAIP